MKRLVIPISILLLILTEFIPTFLVMPFPGSQNLNYVGLAHFLAINKWWIRLILLIPIIWRAFYLIREKKWVRFGFTCFFLLFYGFIVFMLTTKIRPEKMFVLDTTPEFQSAGSNKVAAGKLVIGISVNGESKAYPLEIIAYHHQVRDTIGGQPVLVTYCSACRTGRVFSPIVDGKVEYFTLVGMDHFDAMFQDITTKSWWRQATGEAVAGKLKGNHLNELVSEQMTLASWLRKYPDSKILQPDPKFLGKYKGLVGYDEGKMGSTLEDRNFSSWQKKSWVIGIEINNNAKSYDWNKLVRERVINDKIGDEQIIIALENDSVSFHAWEWPLDNGMSFQIDSTGNYIVDNKGFAKWNMDGKCVEGTYVGSINLQPINASQEFLHAWEEFHPASVRDE